MLLPIPPNSSPAPLASTFLLTPPNSSDPSVRFINLLWMPAEAVVLELFPHRSMITPIHRNLAKFASVTYLSWANPRAKVIKHPAALSLCVGIAHR